MAFRTDEAARTGNEEAINYLVPKKDYDTTEAYVEARDKLIEIIDDLGPAVDTYPTWHPLVAHQDPMSTTNYPSVACGYSGLDHTRYFVHGFITCPYGDGQTVLDSVANLPANNAARISAERLDIQLYNNNTTAILVRCDWYKSIGSNHQIPLRLALPLFLEMEIQCWHRTQCAETWDTMRGYFLGTPSGSRSSLFVSQETGVALKKAWEMLINSGMFGPIKPTRW